MVNCGHPIQNIKSFLCAYRPWFPTEPLLKITGEVLVGNHGRISTKKYSDSWIGWPQFESESVYRLRWYREQAPKVRMVSGMREIYAELKAQSRRGRTLAISDDYVWWSLHGERSDGGKLLVLDGGDEQIQEIFFDDNLECERAGIVDVRKLDVDEGRTCRSDVEWPDLKRKHLLKVEPLEVILNDDYFTEKIAQFEAACASE